MSKNYKRHFGGINKCPVCESRTPNYTPWEFTSIFVVRHGTCDKCSTEFTEVFKYDETQIKIISND